MEKSDNSIVNTTKDNTVVNISVDNNQLKSLIDYFTRLASTMLDVEKDLIYKELVKQSELITQFSTDAASKVITISAHLEDNDSSNPKITIDSEFFYQTRKANVVCFIKKSSQLYLDKPFSSQIQVTNFSSEDDESNVFQYMQNMLTGAINPLFSSYKTAITGGGNESKNIKANSLDTVNNKMVELIFLLNQSQKNSEIPSIKLEPEPELKQRMQDIIASGKTPTVDDFQDKLNDEYTIKLIDLINRWKVDISGVIKLDRQINQGTVLQEINFWKDYETTVVNIQEQLNTPETQMTLHILRAAKKFIVANSFEEDTQLESTITRVKSYNSFLKDLPIVQLTTNKNINNISNILKKIFDHLKTKIRNSSYPFGRTFALIEVLSKDLNSHLLDILNNSKLMNIEYEEFYLIYKDLKNLFTTWGNEYQLAKKEISAWQKTRRDKSFTAVPTTFEHNALDERMRDIKSFRSEHNSLREITETLINSEEGNESNLIKDLDSAYIHISSINILDLSKEGKALWVKLRNEYNKKTEKIESQISNFLCLKLSSATNSNEQFRIFSKFNKLITRPRIQNSIQEYQSQLVSSITQSLKDLKNKLFLGYESSSAYHMSKIRGIPDISGHVIWLKQFQRKLNTYKDRMKMVKGDGWETDNEGKVVKDIIESLSKPVNSSYKTVEQWSKDIFKIDGHQSEKILKVVSKHDKLELQVNFDEKTIDLFKEVRLISSMGIFTLNTYISNKANEIKTTYPVAIALQDSIRTFNQTSQRVDSKIAKLVAKQRKEIQDLIGQNMTTAWGNFIKLEKFSKDLCEKVSVFEEMVRDLLLKAEQIQVLLTLIANSDTNKDFIHDKIREIQFTINEIQETCNIHSWIKDQDNKLESILIKKLEDIIHLYMKEFKEFGKTSDIFLVKEASVHKIKLKDQTIYLEPSLHEAREYWYNQLHKAFAIVCSAKRLDYRLESNLKLENAKESTYRNIINLISPEMLKSAYEVVEQTMQNCENYVQTWLTYQVLWDIQPKNIFDKLGDDMTKWQQLMNELRQGRKTFDTSETEKQFGAVFVDYSMVQAKINNKYDAWHKEIMNKFASTLNDNMKIFYTKVFNCRTTLENSSLENAQTDVVSFITEFKEIEKNITAWAQELEGYKSGKNILDKQRFRFTGDSCNIEQVESEWIKFHKIFTKRDKAMSEQIPAIQSRITAESEVIMNRIKELESYWSGKKPVRSDNTNEALNVISTAEGMLKRVKDEYIRNVKAKEMLGLEFSDPARLESVEENIKDLKEVWQALSKVWSSLDKFKETPFVAVIPEKVKVELNEATNEMNLFSNKIRQYEAYDSMKNKIANLKKINILITDLRTDAIKERHWRQILQKANINKSINEMMLGDFWNADLLSKEKPIRDVINQATGELVLENFLRTSKEFWGEYIMELVNYKQKCKLIKGWDDLFTKLDEHINSFSSMTNSPYYNVFKDEIEPWKDKLEKIRLLFNEWIDVQKRYVYLEGIFFGSSDIMTELGSEYNKFKSIDQEFTGLMKKVTAKPKILDVNSIPSIKSILEEKLKQGLERIQKKLYDFLEKQRQYFARFYFIGDEDLLEIIGNSREIIKITRHFNKMFAGLNALTTPDGDEITHMVSRENEEVEFVNKFKVSQDPIIYVWLAKVEDQMRFTLATKLDEAVSQISAMDYINKVDDFVKWIESYPAQIIVLSSQILWSASIESALSGKPLLPTLPNNFSLADEEDVINNQLSALSDQVLKDISIDMRKKLEQLITELVHQRDVVRTLNSKGIKSENDFEWLYFMRFYFSPKNPDTLKKLEIKMSNAPFDYGFEYLGVAEKLIQTPLTDRCYLTLTQALFFRMGGAPFGPAGTGKTESVKALGGQLGRFVLVFNCDETFDFKAMGRIFIGLCQVGAWGCFDEFNRLEERILSAVSQQILIIQTGLKEQATQIELLSKTITLNHAVGSFITMNPGYAGRSLLPDNLKQLFRQRAMIKPDKDMIAQVTLYSQGYKTAERLSSKMVSLFDLCLNQLSSQSHYDFGLRALKSVLVNAGNLKRKEEKLNKMTNQVTQNVEAFEQKILLQSVCNTLIPKLVAEDVPLFHSLLAGVFPDAIIQALQEDELKEKIIEICSQRNLNSNDKFIDKLIQLYSIQRMHHGVMMVGGSGTGKTASWKILMEAMSMVEGKKFESYVIDPKAVNKDNLYGKLDPTTLDWTDGVFTGTLRKIIDNERGESAKNHWIIFDGDVDPEWAENLNSVLDDNKLFTLPHGDRLSIPSNVRIMFEVESLKYATLATVSRCGMVWFSEDIVSTNMIFEHYLRRLPQNNYDDNFNYISIASGEIASTKNNSNTFQTQNDVNLEERSRFVKIIRGLFEPNGFVQKALEIACEYTHVMELTKIRIIESMFALVRKGLTNVLEYNDMHSDFQMSEDQVFSYLSKWVTQAVIWGFGGSLNLDQRVAFSNRLYDLNRRGDIEFPPESDTMALIDYEVKIGENSWSPWKKKVPTSDVDSSKVSDADVVIITVDTLRHQEILCSWISEHRPFILCGPPGSGKTMTLMATLKVLTDFDMIFINFSSSTTPELILKTFDHYCEYKKLPYGTVLRPKQANKWMVLFCDEINLPEMDKYGTQIVITFLREITEQNGFWRPSDKTWISLERIQFVGACNPPTDVGRHPLSNRFLRHTPLLYVDFPGPESLKQIYGTFNKALLRKGAPELRNYSENLTEAMVEFYTSCQKHYTPDVQPHYIYSPRELTRWKHAINESIEALNTVEDLVRLWAHEALRLFQDRLVLPEEKEWCDKKVDETALKHFPNLGENALQRPILFTNLISQQYVSCDQQELITNIEGKLKVFYEEELNVPLVIFDSVLDHILRIDRVLKQPIGHLLLVGQSGVGKTTLSRFVAWMNNLTVFQIKAGRNYSVENFDEDLRMIMKRAGCKGEKICFIFDESNVLGPAFLERMNALLASGEVPGLYDGEDYISLISTAKECFMKENKVLDTEEEIYKAFIKGVQRNLHVVFTMNPLSPDFSNRAASSPALYNRCVIDWFGDWTREGLFQVANKLTEFAELRQENFSTGNKNLEFDQMHGMLVDSITSFHINIKDLNNRLQKSSKKFNYITPRDFLDFIKHFMNLQKEKSEDLNEQQVHINKGLQKIIETEETVNEMKQGLSVKEIELSKKQAETKQKFSGIMEDTEIARKAKEKAENQKIEIEKMKVEIKERTEYVNKQLKDVQPKLDEAKNSVSNMDNKSISEIRGMKVANEKTITTMRILANIYYYVTAKKSPKKIEWGEIKTAISKEDFLSVIKNLNEVPDKVVQYVKEEISNPANKWDISVIKKASFTVGIMASWVDATINFSEISNSIEPWKLEIQQLEDKRHAVEEDFKVIEQEIKDLESRVDRLKAEHDQSVVESNKIQRDMEEVMFKVERSEKLLNNLTSEKDRWSDQMRDFQRLGNNLLGDTFIASAFLAYIGFYEAGIRAQLKHNSRDIMIKNSIMHTETLDEVDWLSKANDKANWQRCNLPSDAVCFENATVLQRFNRYPLIVDPANQATEFIKLFYSQHSKTKLASTSFTDPNFIKTLEGALRFGYPILVQDVEKIDPIMNALLNKETFKQGGRVLIRIGDQEIDFSSSFNMFMVTRDSSCGFTPDLCSRVTFLNFTITPSSLQNQILSIILKAERPEINNAKEELIKSQREYKVQLRELEDNLLAALNSEGNLLENDKVMSQLENIKTKSMEISEKVSKTEEVMMDLEITSNEYLPIATMSSKVYFSMDSLENIFYLYKYSLSFFMDILFYVLNSQELAKIGKTNYIERQEYIISTLFKEVYHRVGYSLLNKDKMIFAMRLSQIRLGDRLKEEIDILLKSQVGILGSTDGIISPTLLQGKLGTNEKRLLATLVDKEPFKGLVDDMRNNEDSWIEYLNTANGESNVPLSFLQSDTALNEKDKNLRDDIYKSIILSSTKTDRMMFSVSSFINKLFGDNFLNIPELDIKKIVDTETHSKSPILLCSAPGFDASTKIERLAKSLGKRFLDIAIGSQEGFDLVEKHFPIKIKSGDWLILKNVHLAPNWLNELEKKLFSNEPHKDFRLFLTMEFNPKIPPNVLRISRKLVFELPSGIKHSLIRSYNNVLGPKSEVAPMERCKLHFLLSWFHAVIGERLRYAPIGWSKYYEFNESDQRCSLDAIDNWLDIVGKGKQNVDPDKIPWDAIRTTISQSMYGGRVDNEYDLKILESLVNHCFNPNTFDLNYNLFKKGENSTTTMLTIPECKNNSQYLRWIEDLPAIEAPEWSGLPNNAEKLLKENIAKAFLVELSKLQGGADDDLGNDSGETGEKKSWFKQAAEKADLLLSVLPERVFILPENSNSSNPIHRFLNREITVCGKLLSKVRSNLKDIIEVEKGTIKTTNELREISADILKDYVPRFWKVYADAELKVAEWVMDLKNRVNQLNKVSALKDFGKQEIWLGGIIFPEAYLTATRQYVAQHLKVSLDELNLVLDLTNDNPTSFNENEFGIIGLTLEGAEWNFRESKLFMSDSLFTNLPKCIFKWAKKEDVKPTMFPVPVYLNTLRKNLLFSVLINNESILTNYDWYQRGIALVGWNKGFEFKVEEN